MPEPCGLFRFGKIKRRYALYSRAAAAAVVCTACSKYRLLHPHETRLLLVLIVIHCTSRVTCTSCNNYCSILVHIMRKPARRGSRRNGGVELTGTLPPQQQPVAVVQGTVCLPPFCCCCCCTQYRTAPGTSTIAFSKKKTSREPSTYM